MINDTKHTLCKALTWGYLSQRCLRPASDIRFKWPYVLTLSISDLWCQGPWSSQELTWCDFLVSRCFSEVGASQARQVGWGLGCWGVLQSDQVLQLWRVAWDSAVILMVFLPGLSSRSVERERVWVRFTLLLPLFTAAGGVQWTVDCGRQSHGGTLKVLWSQTKTDAGVVVGLTLGRKHQPVLSREWAWPSEAEGPAGRAELPPPHQRAASAPASRVLCCPAKLPLARTWDCFPEVIFILY